jgi:hypothetical protein
MDERMITIVFCLRRLPGLSREEFQHYGLAGHAPLAREHAAVLGIRRYVQSHSSDRATAASLAA